MAVLIAKGSGNLTDSTKWGVVDSTSYLNAEHSTEHAVTTAYSGTRSAAFTPGAITIDGIAIKLCERIGTTGTISVNLEKDSDNSQVAGTEVTIDVADLPSALKSDLNGGWIFFKFAAPVLLLAATAYQVAVKTSSATQVELWKDATSQNIDRALRTTTEAAPGAGDDMIITGEKTGAGAETAITITMNETATTDYGAASTSLVTPAMAICDGGILRYGTTAATNYYLKLSGHCIVYSGGQLDIGTTGTPIPRDSTAVLEFDCGSDGDFGLTIRNNGTLNSQGLSRTSGKNIIACKLNTDEAANQTTLGVDTDTGWLDNDEIVVASTTRTAGDTEKGTLNGNAGASSLTVDGFGGAGGGLANAHSGTSPTQAEVILLTRNVKIRSASSTAMSYVDLKASCTVDIDWTEIYYVGTTTSTKEGVNINSTNVNIQYSSIHDTDFNGLNFGSSAGTAVFSNNVLWKIASQAASTDYNPITVSSAAATPTLSGNYFFYIKTGSSTSGNPIVGINVFNSNFTNNVIVGVYNSASNGALGWGNSAVIGTVSGNVIHSCSGHGIIFELSGSSNGAAGIISSTTIYRCTSEGIVGRFFSGTAAGHYLTEGITFDTLTMFGNGTANINFRSFTAGVPHVYGNIIFKNFTSNGDSTFSTTDGIRFEKSPALDIQILTGDFGTVTGIKTAHTQDLNATVSYAYIQMYLNNVKLASGTEVTNIPGNMTVNSFIKSTNHDQTAGNHKTWLKYGTITSDTTHYNNASPSERLTPNNASNKLVSGSKKVAVASGQAATIHVYVRESESGDGAAYNGARARLMLKRNDAIGITSDTLIDTATAASDGAFEELTGTTSAASADGVMEFYVEVDGTTGWVNVDDWSVTVA